MSHQENCLIFSKHDQSCKTISRTLKFDDKLVCYEKIVMRVRWAHMTWDLSKQF